MIKKTIKYFLYLLILITIGVIYLSYFGIETKKFNNLIKDKISQTNSKIDIELNEVKIILNFDNFTVGIKTSNPNIVFEDKKIKLKKIETNFPIRSFFKKEFTIKNAKIATKENSLKDIIKATRTFRNTPQLYIFDKMVKEGVIIADIDLNFDDNGKLITGKVGKDLDIDQAYDAAKRVGISLLSEINNDIGFEKVNKIVKILGLVNCTEDFIQQPQVINGCSDLFVEYFGEKGKHARSALGVYVLPNNIPVEIEAIIELNN